MFFCDDVLREYESDFKWDDALKYLENVYNRSGSSMVLNTLVGCSWYYLIEGPIVSRRYANDPNVAALETWKRYLTIGEQNLSADPYFNFIAGYTLSLNGFIIGKTYEQKGLTYIERCLSLAEDFMLQKLAENFLINQGTSRYVTLKNGKQICDQLFSEESLLCEYFREIYGA